MRTWLLALAIGTLLSGCGAGLFQHSGSAGSGTLSLSQSGIVSFGISTSGTPVHQSFTFTNIGTAAVTALDQASVAGAAFGFRGGSWPGTGGTCTTSLAPAASCTFAVTFHPQASGGHLGNFSLAYSRAAISLGLSGDATGGGIDTTFGTGEIATASVAGVAGVRALSVAPDGKIVVGGMVAGEFLTSRWLSSGQPDPGYGTGGVAVTTFSSGSDQVYGIIVQTDGKIVAGGAVYPTGLGAEHFGLVRYTTDGTRDATFDGDGIRLDSFAAGNNELRALTLQTDGKIIAIGGRPDGFGGHDFVVARYLTDGTLDPTFGGGGYSQFDFSTFDDFAQAGAVQTDGKIILAGMRSISIFTDVLVAARYLSDGNLDTAFGTAGVVTMSIGTTTHQYRAVRIQSDGKILLGGEANRPTTGSDYIVARYLTDGTLDPTFGTAGVAIASIPGGQLGYGLAIQSDGKVLSGGVVGTIYRFLSNGTTDTSFGNAGLDTVTFSTGSMSILALITQTDGKILAGGTYSSGSVPAVVRLFP